MTTTLWLVRHGETEWTLSGQHTGRTDISLTENGRKQAQSLAPRLSGQAFDHVLCSPLQRARETCALAGYEARAQIEQDLLEWDYGIYEGRTSAEIASAEPGWSLWTSSVPNGETTADVQLRATRLVNHLLELGGTTLLFAHAHILRSVIGVWATGDVRLGEHIVLDTGSVSILGFHRDARVIRKLNA
ncbi:histidine phosphatase family protein [Gluconobacter morbifer]|uniref:Fructose-2,6-bisphosphatase n=1 Tax=Gluconobacter morbifer G707 TaxID=1088869 RepID=G6XK08_9PROT|nr:histidine phosphatase family protein [Gluconobacter morbifer]EHH67970.1 Fructose-2,6-bisphosphatase [Gluconobacter morbifer G707]